MTTTALLVLTLIAAGPATGPSAEDLKAYDALKVQTGRDPAEQVKLALWCESHGLQTERLKHLALAVKILASRGGGSCARASGSQAIARTIHPNRADRRNGRGA